MARKPVTVEGEVTRDEQPAKASKSRAVAKRSTSTEVSTDVYDWRKEIAGYAAKTLKQEESVSAGNRVSTRGGVLSYKQTPLKDNKLTCVMLTTLVENAYYEGAFDPDNPKAPVCFAFGATPQVDEDGNEKPLPDGINKPEEMEPHEKSHDRQNATCKGCEHNEFGSADKGRGKACKNIRRIALLPLEMPFTVQDIEEAEIATLSVPVMSVKGYALYVKDLAIKSNLPEWAWSTVISCAPDPKSQYRVTFQSADRKPLPDKFYNAILARVKEAEKTIGEPYVYVDAATVEKEVKRGAKSASARRSKY